MNDDEALGMIKEALNIITPEIGDKITTETHLISDDILDSLDLMSFMFELEQLRGSKIEEITETFDDFRVSTLIGFLTKQSQPG